jgi:hypothetical protein
MARKNINTERIEGRVYQHTLAVKQVSSQTSANYGKDFISGELDVAVDEEGLNVITVHYTYVTETTSKGAKNATYAALKQIIDTNATWTTVGKEAATKVRIDTALALNDFYASDDSLVSVKRNEGGFVTIVDRLSDESERNKFTVDMFITKIDHVDANPEKNITEHTSVHGAIFDFRNAILPVDFVVENPAGMKYFESLEVSGSEPLYTKVWGKIMSLTSTRSVAEESAFGEASVRTYETKSRSWVITGTAKNPYDFGDEEVLTAEDVTKALQDRQVYLAGVKKRADDYKASRNAAVAPTPAAATPSAPAKKGSFNF